MAVRTHPGTLLVVPLLVLAVGIAVGLTGVKLSQNTEIEVRDAPVWWAPAGTPPRARVQRAWATATHPPSQVSRSNAREAATHAATATAEKLVALARPVGALQATIAAGIADYSVVSSAFNKLAHQLLVQASVGLKGRPPAAVPCSWQQATRTEGVDLCMPTGGTRAQANISHINGTQLHLMPQGVRDMSFPPPPRPVGANVDVFSAPSLVSVRSAAAAMKRGRLWRPSRASVGQQRRACISSRSPPAGCPAGAPHARGQGDGAGPGAHRAQLHGGAGHGRRVCHQHDGERDVQPASAGVGQLPARLVLERHHRAQGDAPAHTG